MPEQNLKGRGVSRDLPNRFRQAWWEPEPGELPDNTTELIEDHSASILNRNSSPDVPFGLGLNPYRGCEHGCVYCYARPSHEYLGYSAGLDFERKIVFKPRAPGLLREALSKRS
jgi:DNA repair photolyase